MRKKTIHAVVKYFYPVAAGIETNMLETYSVLAKKGWRVIVHTSKNTLTKENILKTNEIIKGVVVKRYKYRFFSFWPEIPWGRTDVVALHNFNVIPHSFLLCYAVIRKVIGLPVPLIFLTPHGGFTPDWLIFSPFVAFIKKVFHFSIGTMLINAAVDITRAVSEWERKEIVKSGVSTKKVITLTNGIEDEAYVNLEKNASKEIKSTVKKYGTYIIQIGRIYNIKNYETVIQAVAKLPKELNFVILGPVGDEKYKDMLVQLINKLGLQNRVFFGGVIRGVDKYYLIKHAALMVHMARWESFCNAVHEGMSQGLPCVVADNTALPLLIKNDINGYCVPTNNVSELASIVSRLYKDRDLAYVKKIKETNRIFGLQHSWRSVAEELNDILLEKIRNK